ncbi:thiol-disulfide isomerase [Pseudomonas cichorii]|nr:thiol-disulfide isomerase [Pseudomonas cichorii]MBX8571356.1 thiol-disulfide isomerase [Pseudomonas cichorii]
MKAPHRRNLFACLFVLICAAGLWMAHDWFQHRYLRPFSDQTALFSGDDLRLPAELAGPGRIRLVHFKDPTCPCNVGNQQHLSELIERFGGDKGVDFYVVQKPGTTDHSSPAPDTIKTLETLPGAEKISASPAVAIWDRDGKLAYFGPYSEGLTCNSGNSFIEPILNALLDGRSVNTINTMAVGCYCAWQ